MKSKKMTNSSTDLNITSLLDVLTVLLLFLIQSTTITSMNLQPPKGIRLPASDSQKPAEEAIKVALGKEGLLVDNALVVPLQNGYYPSESLGEDKRTLIKLEQLLKRKQKKRAEFFAGVARPEDLPPVKLLIQADKGLKFKLVKHILHTAVVAGYSDYQFVVKKQD